MQSSELTSPCLCLLQLQQGQHVWNEISLIRYSLRFVQGWRSIFLVKWSNRMNLVLQSIILQHGYRFLVECMSIYTQQWSFVMHACPVYLWEWSLREIQAKFRLKPWLEQWHFLPRYCIPAQQIDIFLALIIKQIYQSNLHEQAQANSQYLE